MLSPARASSRNSLGAGHSFPTPPRQGRIGFGSGFQRVLLRRIVNFEGWNSQAQREFRRNAGSTILICRILCLRIDRNVSYGW